MYGSESYKISDSIDDAKDLLDFICKTKLNNHGKIYFADLSTKMSYEYGFFVAKNSCVRNVANDFWDMRTKELTVRESRMLFRIPNIVTDVCVKEMR